MAQPLAAGEPRSAQGAAAGASAKRGLRPSGPRALEPLRIRG